MCDVHQERSSKAIVSSYEDLDWPRTSDQQVQNLQYEPFPPKYFKPRYPYITSSCEAFG